MSRFSQAILALILVFFSSHLSAQSNKEAYSRTSKLLYKNLQKAHFNPISLTDSVGKHVLENVLYDLDPEHIYFVKGQIEAMQAQQYQIDDQIRDGNADVLLSIIEQYELALEQTIKAITALELQTLDFQKVESISLSRKSFQSSLFPTNAEQEGRLRKYLKWDILDKASADSAIADLGEKEEGYRIKICQRWKQQLRENIEELKEESNAVSRSYFNAIAQEYDPHTAYFSVSEMKLFETMLSDAEYSFGFGFAEDRRGNIEITSLTPGGSAWKSNELNKGDILLTLTEADETRHDLSFTTALKLNKLLESFGKGISVQLTVRKKSGVLKSVVLKKEKTENEDNVINSFLLEGHKKIGYISLPSFYTDMEGETNLGCANDVAKQLIYLKRDGIEGLVLDLRNNGGGSMQEAIDLIGMFIDVGPVAITRNKKEELTTLKDVNRGAIYSGPMVVLTNKFSASASEFFAAAMQDYHRALIVGGTTFGKSTGQNILPLASNIENELLDAWSGDNDMGFMKVTTFKFYRITGKSHQQMGVVPDIPLPQILDAMQIGEDSYPTSLPADSVEKKTYARLLPTLPIEQLWSKSNTRIQSSDMFKEIPNRLSELHERFQNPIAQIPLKASDYQAYLELRNKILELLELKSDEAVNAYKVGLATLDREIVELVPSTQKVYDIRMKGLQTDIYLEEAYQVLTDWIKLK